jgi:hypothetical protein
MDVRTPQDWAQLPLQIYRCRGVDLWCAVSDVEAESVPHV